MFYEILKDLTDYGMQKWIFDADYRISSSLEGLVLGGVAGGINFSLLLSVWISCFQCV